MRLESAINTSREGITAHGQAIAVVGDNISNASTPAFKRGRAEFADIMGEIQDQRNAEVGPTSGDGAFIRRTRLNFEAGAVDYTGRSLDVALSGNGFFLVGDPAAPMLTRLGNFQVAADGTLQTPSGEPVLGYQGADVAQLVPINMQQVNIQATATTTMELFGNIDASLSPTTPPPPGSAFAEINNAAAFVASQSVYDSLGERHDVTLTFFKNSANQWTVQSYVNGSETGAGDNVPVLVGQVTLNFNSLGQIDEAAAPAANIQGTINWSNGAAASPLTLDLKAFTQYAGGSRVTNSTQDGRGGGEIINYDIDATGDIYALLASGERAQVGTLPVAIVQNVDGLKRQGGSLYATSSESGAMEIGFAGQGGSGELAPYSLESSNVDIANQFVELVIYQRGYQANSQVLSAASEMLKGTIALIR
jgi:flagellar hook protein FlgE